MTEMPNKEVLNFNRPEESKDFPVQIDGTSALKLDDIPEEQNCGKEIEEVKDEINATQGLTVVEPVNEEVIFEPIKDIDSRSKFTKFADRVSKSIRKAGLKIGTMFLASATLSSAAACGPIETAESTPQPVSITAVQGQETNSGSATVQISNNENPETTEVVIDTPSPSPEPTETPIFSEERTVELNQQIPDFNNNQGEFTKEKKSEMAINSQTTEKNGSTELGLQIYLPRLEGYFFDYFEKDGSLILIMGFDGKDGKGFTTPVQIPLYFFKGESKAKFNFAVRDSSTTKSAAIITNKDTTAMFTYLDKIKNSVIMIQPAFQPYPGSKDDHTGATKDYFIEHESKLGIAGKLISSVATNGIEIKNENYHESDYENYTILKLDNLDNIEDIDLSLVPMIDSTIIFTE